MDLKDKQKIVKLIGNADEALQKLEHSINSYKSQGKTPPKYDMQLYSSIERALNNLKKNPFCGDCVKKELIPKELLNLPNLFRIELSQFWRLLYYVTGDQVKVIAVVFEICDHPNYNKIFSYKKK